MPDEVASNFQGLPMRELISAPLISVCEAQLMLAQASYNYMTKIGFKTKAGQDGQVEIGDPNLLSFKLQRPVETPDGITTSEITVQAPFLGLVPIPSLLIDNVNVDFQMEVTSAVQAKDDSTSETTLNANADFKLGFFGKAHVDMHGKVTSSRESTRSTNQTAKYQVSLSAHQQPPTEGLSKLMDILASCTQPLKIEAQK